MILHQLQLKNYKQYTNLELTFREGLTGIVGRNGAGKSTLFDAVLYCLFGRDEDRKENIRSTYSNDNEPVELTLTFEVNGKLYRIQRVFKGKDLTVSAFLYDGNQNLIARDAKAVNSEITKILNLERQAFKYSVFSGQKELDQLSTATAKDRSDMIRKILGLERLEKIEKKIKEDAKTLKNSFDKLRTFLLVEDNLKQIKNELSLLKENETDLQKAEIQIFKTIDEIEKNKNTKQQDLKAQEKLKDETIKLKNNLSKYEEGIKQIQTSLNTLIKEQEDLEKDKKELSSKEKQILDYEQDIILLNDWRKIKDNILKKENIQSTIIRLNTDFKKIEETIRSSQEALNSFPSLKNQRETLIQEVNLLKQQYDGLQTTATFINQKISEREGKIKDRNNNLQNLQKLGKDSNCPTCFQPLKDNYDKTIQNFLEEIKEFEQEILNDFQLQKNTIEHQLKENQVNTASKNEILLSLEKKIAQLQQLERQHLIEIQKRDSISKEIVQTQVQLSQLGDLKIDENQFFILEKRVHEGQLSYEQYKTRKNFITERLPKVHNDIELLKSRIENGKAEIQKVLNELQQITFDETAFTVLRNQMESISLELSQKTKEHTDLKIKIIEEKNKIDSIQEKLNSDKKLRENVEAEEKEYEALKKLSSFVNTFKTKILQRIAPSISETAGNLFSLITKGRYEGIEIDENYEFYVYEQGKKVTLNRLSGGEVDLANLCLRIALTKAIGEINGTNALNFLAFDEIFGSQDEERRQEIMAALILLQEQFKQIYIISHIESVRELFPNVLQVSLDAKGSQAKWLD